MKIGIIVVLMALLTACGENKDKERTISVSILPSALFRGENCGGLREGERDDPTGGESRGE